jgi:16S rRNA (cytidine1402-2'-O)-methyltransferase
LLALAADPRTVVFFEAPHRIRGTLEQARAVLGDREVSVARELTKLHEEVLRGRLSDVLSRLTAPRGEFTVVMAGAAETVAAEAAQPADNQVLAAFDEHVSSGCTRREAIAAVARRFGLRTRDTYAAVERARHS